MSAPHAWHVSPANRKRPRHARLSVYGQRARVAHAPNPARHTDAAQRRALRGGVPARLAIGTAPATPVELPPDAGLTMKKQKFDGHAGSQQVGMSRMSTRPSPLDAHR